MRFNVYRVYYHIATYCDSIVKLLKSSQVSSASAKLLARRFLAVAFAAEHLAVLFGRLPAF